LEEARLRISSLAYLLDDKSQGWGNAYRAWCEMRIYCA
jgi:hypothetical protein